MNIELLQQLCEASAVSGDEQEVRDILINTLEPCVNEITFDGLGSFVARKGNKGPKVAVVGHMDEVGFMVTHIDESGFLRFTTIGGWWNQSMLNHRVTIRTHKGVKIPGLIDSVAPHRLTEKQKQQPLSFDEMFIDIGANSREEVEKRGVAMGDFISPEANFACWGEDKVVGKALDNRIGCAMMAELLQTVNNPEITLYGVGSVEEEVGLRFYGLVPLLWQQNWSFPRLRYGWLIESCQFFRNRKYSQKKEKNSFGCIFIVRIWL